MMHMDPNLNKAQTEAVKSTNGPLLILAGAGSGKTRVITHRIAHIISSGQASPFQIFAVTFTNKAASEMKKRIQAMIGAEGDSVFIKTFHSACVYILHRYGETIGIPPHFSIYDQSDQQNLVKGILKDMRLDPKKVKPSMIVSKISEIKDKASLIQGTDINSMLPDYFSFNFKEIYEEYHRALTQRNALDFNDLLIKTVELLRNSETTLQLLQNRWTHFMVDEYQDTNYAQYCITTLLAAKSKNICVVGDDDQSIYSWRGADIRNILDFEKEYPETRVITLEENYRSTAPILECARAVITNNSMRKDKNIRSRKGDGEMPVWCRANNEYGEAAFTVDTIISLKNRENYKNTDFAIFYRTNAQSRVFEEHLRREGIPYRVIGGLKFYDRKEIKDTIAYMRFIANPADSIALHRIINTPIRGIGSATLEKIASIASETKKTHWEVIRDELLTGRVPAKLSEFTETMTGLLEMKSIVPSDLKLSNLVQNTLNKTGYLPALKQDNSPENQSRIENIDEFINSIYEYESLHPDADLTSFLQDISLLTSEDTPNTNSTDPDNVITLMTIHNAKGLEFPVVFLTGMEERTFPHSLCQDTDEGIEEERRLCYVGITRAMERLYMTSADIRRSFMGVEYREPSRFIWEIPSDLIEEKRYSSEGSQGTVSSASFRQKVNETYVQRKPVQENKPESGKSKKKDSMFSIYEKIIHPKYGSGQIIKIEGTGDNTKLTIAFGTVRKTFMEKYTPLEKI